MGFHRFIWGWLFRLFPCPSKTGLRRLGDPGPESPVLVTCNFDLTLRRLQKALRGLDLWLLVADSKGINVWCAAGAGELNTRSVVTAVKTSALADKVTHRTLILPPLAAPGVRAAEVTQHTGWKVFWGPARALDIPRYIRHGFRRSEKMKRVTYSLWERLDTALGSLFPFILLGAAGLALFAPHLWLDYILVAGIAFFIYFGLCPWIPGSNGLRKALFLDLLLGAILLAACLLPASALFALRRHLILAMVILAAYGLELGGLASTMRSDLDPFLARLGIRSIGNAAFHGTLRAELLLGIRTLSYKAEACRACHACIEVCPQGVWEVGEGDKAVLAHAERCTACRACLTQCCSGAIRATKAAGRGLSTAGSIQGFVPANLRRWLS